MGLPSILRPLRGRVGAGLRDWTCGRSQESPRELFRVVARIDHGIDTGFETTPVSNLGPTFYGFRSLQGRFLPFSGVFLDENSGTSGGAHATPTKASLLAPPLTDTPNV